MKPAHELTVAVQDCYFPAAKGLEELTFSVTVAGTTMISNVGRMQFPMSQPLVFADGLLQAQDCIRIEAKTPSDDLGSLEIVLREQFPIDLSGDFEMWFKLTDPTSFISPEKERPERSKRVGRLKVRVTLRQVQEKEEEVPEGTPDCLRCAYLEKLIVSMELEIEGRLEIRKLFDSEGDDKHEHALNTEETAGETQETTARYMSPEEIEIEHLKMVILALNEKMTALQLEKSDAESLKDQLADGVKARERVRNSAQDAFEQMKKQAENAHERLAETQGELATVRSQAQTFRAQLADAQSQIARIQSELLSASMKLEGWKARDQSAAASTSQIDDLQQRLLLEEAETEALHSKLSAAIGDFRTQSDQWASELESRNKELSRQRSENDGLRAAIAALREELDIMKQDNLSLKGKSRTVEAERDSLRAQLGQCNRRSDEVSACEQARTKLQKELLAFSEMHNRKAEDFLATIEKLQQENARLKSAQIETETALRKSIAQSEQIARESSAFKAALAEQRQISAVLIDAQEAAEALQRKLGCSKEAQGRLVSDINFLADSLMSVSERSLEVSRLVPRLKSLLEEKDIEVEVLRTMVSDFQKSRPSYVPVKDDPVDSAIASFVNSQKHLPVAFCRQDEGLYLFGTKRVFTKLENGNIVSKF